MSVRGWHLGVLASLGLLGCGPLFQRPRPAVERVSPEVAAGKFEVIATIAGGNSRTDLRMSVTVRQMLQDSGFTVVRRAGRWDSELDAMNSICEGATVDGVLVVSYDRLGLRDCRTKKLAYEISAGTSKGITGMTESLIHYLRREQSAPPPPPK